MYSLGIIKNHQSKKFICKLFDSKTGALISMEHGKYPSEILSKINTNAKECQNTIAIEIWCKFEELVLSVSKSEWFK